jgi:hypothetical protein
MRDISAMDVLQTLGIALGLAALAGVNLYLTVFAAGLAIHFGWVILPSYLAELSALGNPWLVSIAGGLYFLDFFADKIPWVDTANDAFHTFVRPLGGAVLAVLALGEADPAIKVIAALLAGGVALTSHAAKAGTRLVANSSPEPASNIGLSLGEDALVLGGLSLLYFYPIIAMVLILVVLITIWLVLPRLLRSIQATLWLAWKKLNGAPAGNEAGALTAVLPAGIEQDLRRAHATAEPVAFAVRCLSGGGPRLPKNRFGWLVRLEGGRLFFLSRRWQGSLVVEIPQPAEAPERASRFLCERLGLPGSENTPHVFIFERGSRVVADLIASQLAVPFPPPAPDPEPLATVTA